MKVPKPRYYFCWVCSRRLHGRHHRIAVVNGNEVVVHVQCADAEKLEVRT